MEHVDNVKNPCHGQHLAQFKGMHLQFAPHLGKTMKDWIVDNIMFGHLATQIMAKHQQHCYEQDFFGKSWTHNHFVLPHDICNATDTYVSLEYKCHWDVTTSIRLWADANLNKMLFFQQEAIALTSIWLKFSIGIQIAS